MIMVDRRGAMQFGAGAAAAMALSGAGRARQTEGAPFVTDDIGALRQVLVHTLTEDEYPVDRLSGALIPNLNIDRVASARQHRALIALLNEAGAETVELVEALDGAIEEARSRGSWRAWLSAAHPALSTEPDRVTAATLLGRDPARQFQRREDGSYRHLFNDTTSTMWTRDASFMTPSGLVVCNALSERRLRENMTLRFVMEHAPQMADIPVAFDAVAEGVILEGGDAQMVDENTLFLGVGQRSDPRAPAMLARRLDLDVVAVHVNEADFLARSDSNMGGGQLSALRVLFLHLDTFFTHVDREHVLTVPWLLEMEHAGEDPLTRYIEGARADLAVDSSEAEKALKFLKDFGKVSVWRAGTGRKEDIGEMKLVDYVKERGYQVTYVAGQEPDDSAEGFAAFMRDTLGELRRQASNVVATAPGAVIAYDGSPLTRAALERDGVSVATFEARDLWANHGGPHCLTMPLRRG
ncbi:hypothetical protein FKB34_03390 [Glycocaulis profundi]|nr:hypothetical protein FKB34_03390 [Glycocaulis profundi]